MSFKRAGLLLVVPVFLGACGGSSGITANGGNSPPIPSDDNPGVSPPIVIERNDLRTTDSVVPYKPAGRYADVLKTCALARSADEACTLDTLPFISMESPEVSREDVLNRLLVSHDWMGIRFEQLLMKAPDSLVSLFGAVTSIVIASDVRPSNYWIVTGGISLDPASMWLTIGEKANVSIEQDYRDAFGSELQFWFFFSQRINGERAYASYSLIDESVRTLEDIEIPVYSLWFHELAHAVDFFPPSIRARVASDRSPYNAVIEYPDEFLSPRLYEVLPLTSQLLYELAQVSFNGQEIVEEQKSYSPAFVGNSMANDSAMTYYSYSTIREDFAVLFSEAMMKMTYNVDLYIAFVDKPADQNNYSCNELLVGWGVKNRLADPGVSSRAQWVVQRILGPDSEAFDFISRYAGVQEPMLPGVDWCTNRDGSVFRIGAGADSLARARAGGRDGHDAQMSAAERLQLEHERRPWEF